MSWFNPLSWFAASNTTSVNIDGQLNLTPSEQQQVVNELARLQELVAEAQDAFKCADANVKALNLSLTLIDDHYSKQVEELATGLMGAVILNGGPIKISKEIVEIVKNPEDDSTVNTKVNEDGSIIIFIAEGEVDEYDDFDEENFDEEFDFGEEESGDDESLEELVETGEK